MKPGDLRLKHGMFSGNRGVELIPKFRAKAYRAWQAMKTRCQNPKYPYFHQYGGRGIVVCDRWLRSFPDFIEDVGMPVTADQSLGRINNDGNYEPGNVRWETHQVQQLNRSNTVRILMPNGENLTITEISRRSGVPDRTIRSRLHDKWPVERLLLPRLSRNSKDSTGQSEDEVQS